MTKKTDILPTIFLSCLVALVLPLILIPVEKLAPYPYIIEEIVKAIFILFILKFKNTNIQLKSMLIIIFLFALSENIFYSTNFITSGSLNIFWKRFILTTSLHLVTMGIILLPSQKNRRFIFPATIVAMFVHFLYNRIILIIFQ